jgi:P-type Cu2+ transporter
MTTVQRSPFSQQRPANSASGTVVDCGQEPEFAHTEGRRDAEPLPEQEWAASTARPSSTPALTTPASKSTVSAAAMKRGMTSAREVTSNEIAATTDAPSRAAASAATCAHCQLPVPRGLLRPGSTSQFCCSGCETAWSLIHDHHLDNYYSMREAWNSRPTPVTAVADTYEEFDHPVYQQRHVTVLRDDCHEVHWLLDGLHCAACVWLLEQLPSWTSGLHEVRVSLWQHTATVRWNPQEQTLSTIARRCATLGYAPRPATQESRREQTRRENRRQLIQLAIAGACAGNVMLLALALYAGQMSGMAAEQLHLLRGFSALVGAVSLLGPGATFYRGAMRAIRQRSPHMDIALTLGLVAGGAMGVVNTIRGAGEIYFDSLCMLIFVLLIGRYLQFRQQRSAADRLSVLQSLVPRTASRLTAVNTVEVVPSDALVVGDRVVVAAGGVLPADGIVTEGESLLDQALLTGESAGVPIAVGSSVTGGATNLAAPVTIEVTAVGTESRVGRLAELVESAALRQSPIVELANRVSGVFFAVVLFVAMGTGLFWLSRGWELAVENTIALLIVACPCALGLATPLTIAVALGRAAKQAMLIRGGELFERLCRPGHIWLDKTGTITQGHLSLAGWHGDRSAQPIVRLLEANVIHPVAEALQRSLGPSPDTAPPVDANIVVEQHRVLPGLGVTGTVAGQQWVVGSLRCLAEHGVDVSAERQWPAHDGIGVRVYVSRNGQLIAAADLADQIRPDSLAAIQALQQRGWTVGILSGDRTEMVQRVGLQLGLPPESLRGDALPETKLQVVESSRADRPVMMVGDGVNDAAALAAADVGVAVHGGAEASLNAAAVYLARPGLSQVVDLIDGSRRTLGAIRAGLVLSLLYNTTAVTLAAMGAITPLLAAVLMPLSSLSVTTLAFRQRTFGVHS